MSAPPTFGTRIPGREYVVRPSAYAVIADGTGARIAVARTPLGRFLPGGGAGPGESPADVVTREAIEEVGLRVTPGATIGEATEFVHAPAEPAGYEKRSTFLAATVAGQGTAVEPDHVLEWLPVATALLALTPPTHRWAVAEWSQRRILEAPPELRRLLP